MSLDHHVSQEMDRNGYNSWDLLPFLNEPCKSHGPSLVFGSEPATMGGGVEVQDEKNLVLRC